jgi:hypothetical protein
MLKPSLSQETRDSTYILANGLDLNREPIYTFEGTINRNQKDKLTLEYKGLTYAQKKIIEQDFDLKKHIGSAYFYDSDNDLIFIDDDIRKYFIESVEYEMTDPETWNIKLTLLFDWSIA